MAWTTLGSKAVGSIVKIKENGAAVNYIVVHQGLPSSIYDSSCDDTWLLRQDIAERQVWDSGNSNVLESSDIHSYLNNTWINRYDADTRNYIKQVKIPYRQNGGVTGTDRNGANGLSCRIFLLSGYELGWTTDISSHLPVDGAKLSYFDSGTGGTANNKRIATLSGNATLWWLRSPYATDIGNVWYINHRGEYYSDNAYSLYGVRPALLLPSILDVDDSDNVITNTAPSTPGSISVPSTINVGDTITITWTASTDAESNLSGYKLEKSVNGGSSWSQIYQGNGRSKTDTITAGTSQVRYRVKAYDAIGLESGYRTSGNVSVNNKQTISCSNGNGSNIGEKNSDFSVSYTVNDADNNSVTVTETVDSVVIRSYTATLGSATNLSVSGETFMTLPNGSHSLKISASDGKATVEHNLTFTKNVTSASVTLKNNMAAASIKVCALSISGSIPSNATLQVLVTNNANDTSPIWEDCTTAVKNGLNYVFTNSTATNGFAFNFKVLVSRGSSGAGGYITSIQGAFQ